MNISTTDHLSYYAEMSLIWGWNLMMGDTCHCPRRPFSWVSSIDERGDLAVSIAQRRLATISFNSLRIYYSKNSLSDTPSSSNCDRMLRSLPPQTKKQFCKVFHQFLIIKFNAHKFDCIFKVCSSFVPRRTDYQPRICEACQVNLEGDYDIQNDHFFHLNRSFSAVTRPASTS